MNKLIKSLIVLMLMSVLAGSASAVTFAWSDMSSFTADDSTPAIPFTVTGNNASYACTLYLNLSGVWTAAGTVEAANDTLSAITCTYSLSPGTTYSYNITAYNATDIPTTFTSSTYTVRYSTFSMLATLVTDMGSIFTAMIAFVIIIVTITVVIAIGTGLVNGFGGMFGTIFSFLKFGKR